MTRPPVARPLIAAHIAACESATAAATTARGTAAALEARVPTTRVRNAIALAREAHEAVRRAEQAARELSSEHRAVQAALYPQRDVVALPVGRRIPLRSRDGSPRAYAMVDDTDYDRVAAMSWCLTASGYAMRQVPLGDGDYRWIRMHRFVLDLTWGDGQEVDHINGDKLDNRRANLRIISHQENCQNVPARGGSSSYRGVGFREDIGKWVARATVNGIAHYLGAFATEEEAAQRAGEFRATHMPGATDRGVMALPSGRVGGGR